MYEHRTLPRPATRRGLTLAAGAAVALLLSGVGTATAGQASSAATSATASVPQPAGERAVTPASESGGSESGVSQSGGPGSGVSQSRGSQSGGPGSGGPGSGVSVFGGLEVKVVEPYEPVVINDELRMGLLPTGRQNYVISSPDRFSAEIEAAKGYVGDDIRPDSISLGVSTEQGEVTLISGAWRLAGTPRDITVSFGNDIDYAAQIVRLPGKPGWGTFYLDTRGQDLPGSFTVTAHDQNGRAFAAVRHEPWLAG
ncbi:hypothetical protein ACLGIH_15055 [Streptomyces sp. HMX87]|uniref:hypothetical protein n=1 Tax=Streptomyces sp. HMX87 TaxID=3390849 RepID=UPI003A8BBEB8